MWSLTCAETAALWSLALAGAKDYIIYYANVYLFIFYSKHFLPCLSLSTDNVGGLAPCVKMLQKFAKTATIFKAKLAKLVMLSFYSYSFFPDRPTYPHEKGRYILSALRVSLHQHISSRHLRCLDRVPDLPINFAQEDRCRNIVKTNIDT